MLNSITTAITNLLLLFTMCLYTYLTNQFLLVTVHLHYTNCGICQKELLPCKIDCTQLLYQAASLHKCFLLLLVVKNTEFVHVAPVVNNYFRHNLTEFFCASVLPRDMKNGPSAGLNFLPSFALACDTCIL